eukprot:3705470-Prymnesium_polylepis.1
MPAAPSAPSSASAAASASVTTPDGRGAATLGGGPTTSAGGLEQQVHEAIQHYAMVQGELRHLFEECGLEWDAPAAARL